LISQVNLQFNHAVRPPFANHLFFIIQSHVPRDGKMKIQGGAYDVMAI
jgi:hypothetical protein